MMQVYWVTFALFSCAMFFPFVWPACQLFTQFHDPSAVKGAINNVRGQFKILQDTDSQILASETMIYSARYVVPSNFKSNCLTVKLSLFLLIHQKVKIHFSILIRPKHPWSSLYGSKPVTLLTEPLC